MATKRQLKAEFNRGKKELPRSLRFLQGENFMAIIRRDTDGKQSWYVELKPATAKVLFNLKNATKQTEEENKTLKKQLSERVNEILELKQAIDKDKEELISTKNANKQILKNQAEDKESEWSEPKSPMPNCINLLSEAGTDLKSKPIPGGLVGACKK